LNEFKSFKEIPSQPEKPAVQVEPSPQVQSFKPTWRPPVVNSEHIKWKPVDKLAARVVAKARWHELPPPPAPKFNKEKTMSERADIQSPREGRIRTKTMVGEDGFRESLYDIDSCTGPAIDLHEDEVKKGIKRHDELLEKAREVTAALDYLVTESRGPWTEHMEFIKSAIATTREQRIALGSETRLLMSSLKEVRQFFLEKDYQEQINRLHDFIDLCERLKALKEDGFLDSIADTILKLT
jgi:hypothetical protein